MMFNLMIAGVGGQGTVLASKLIAAAAMKKGFNVRTTETIGMAQRGGCVFGHCRIGDEIFSPLIPLGSANALIAFEPAEAVRQIAFLGKDGVVLVCNRAVKPVTNLNAAEYKASDMIDFLKANASKLIVVDGQQLEGQNAKTLNVSLLGAAAQSGIFPFDADTLKDILPEMLPQRFLEMNLKAYELGRKLV
ncbi:MAG: indolepyruvate oxidoreductase subunit beta [Treponema sp.]|nr:indolepyruvate oxidoreductase subunit beta [Treponema sp.]